MRVSGPSGALTPELAEEIRRNKADLLEWIQLEAVTQTALELFPGSKVIFFGEEPLQPEPVNNKTPPLRSTRIYTKGGDAMTNSLFSKTILKGKKSSLFLDVAESKSGKPYVKLTQTKKQEGDEDWKKESIFLFPDQLEELQTALEEAEEAIPEEFLSYY